MDHTSLSLLERLRGSGNDPAWSRLVELYAPLIRHWLKQRCKLDDADADDLTQTVLKVMVSELPRFDHNGRPGAFRNWVKTITINRLRDFWRNANAKRGVIDAGSDVLEQWADPNGELSMLWEREHDQFVLNRALELIEHEFAATTWQAFKQSAIEGRKAAFVAAELGISANAVLVAKSRVLARLRQEFAGLTEI
jgi:RNA polymerase sigma factor (sigma-70 family)